MVHQLMVHQIVNIEGRKFVVKWPYIGNDQVWLPVHPTYLKPCKIIGLATKGAETGVIPSAHVNHFIHEIRQPITSESSGETSLVSEAFAD